MARSVPTKKRCWRSDLLSFLLEYAATLGLLDVALLTAIEEGRPVAEIRKFLSVRSGTEIPDTVARLLDDAAERSVRLQDRGLARLIECADPALAALLANDSRIRKYCMRAGDRHLAVPASSEAAFKRAVKEARIPCASGRDRQPGTRFTEPARK